MVNTNEHLNSFTPNGKGRQMKNFTNKSFRRLAIVVILSLSFVIVGCSKNDGDGRHTPDDNVDEASGQLVSLKMDLSDSAGLLTTDSY